jgi:gamma-glutamyl-gamma-aminobutyrate hydrolase PuuD
MQEKSKVNIFFPNNDGNQFKTFLEGLFPDKEVNIVKNWKDTPLSLIVFTGGEDVTPSFYGENVGKHTFTNTMRDQNEFDIFHTIFYGTPKLGICRGYRVA